MRRPGCRIAADGPLRAAIDHLGRREAFGEKAHDPRRELRTSSGTAAEPFREPVLTSIGPNAARFDILGFEIYRDGLLLATDVPGSSFFDDTRSAGAEYTYTLIATNPDGARSEPNGLFLCFTSGTGFLDDGRWAARPHGGRATGPDPSAVAASAASPGRPARSASANFERPSGKPRSSSRPWRRSCGAQPCGASRGSVRGPPGICASPSLGEAVRTGGECFTPSQGASCLTSASFGAFSSPLPGRSSRLRP